MEGERFRYGLNGKKRKDIPAVYCNGLSKLKKAVEDGTRVFYAEGEKDVDSLNSRGLVGVTCGASGDWNQKCSEIFKGADVVILADNDGPGKKSARAIEGDLRKVAKSVKVIVPTPDIDKGDISDFFRQSTHLCIHFCLLTSNVDCSFGFHNPPIYNYLVNILLCHQSYQ